MLHRQPSVGDDYFKAAIKHSNETKVATHDGHIWPVPRARMTDAVAIRERMAADISTARALQVAPEDIAAHLQERGWTLEQLAVHGPAAIDLAASSARRAAA